MGDFARDALGGSMLLAVPVAMLAGLASFFSPCVLPLLPGYLSFASGLGTAELAAGRSRTKVLAGTLGFLAGLSLAGSKMASTVSWRQLQASQKWSSNAAQPPVVLVQILTSIRSIR